MDHGKQQHWHYLVGQGAHELDAHTLRFTANQLGLDITEAIHDRCRQYDITTTTTKTTTVTRLVARTNCNILLP